MIRHGIDLAAVGRVSIPGVELLSPLATAELGDQRVVLGATHPVILNRESFGIWARFPALGRLADQSVRASTWAELPAIRMLIAHGLLKAR